MVDKVFELAGYKIDYSRWDLSDFFELLDLRERQEVTYEDLEGFFESLEDFNTSDAFEGYKMD